MTYLPVFFQGRCYLRNVEYSRRKTVTRWISFDEKPKSHVRGVTHIWMCFGTFCDSVFNDKVSEKTNISRFLQSFHFEYSRQDFGGVEPLHRIKCAHRRRSRSVQWNDRTTAKAAANFNVYHQKIKIFHWRSH